MQDYGEFVSPALRASSDETLSTIGHKMDMYPTETMYQPEMEAVMNQTHALVETYSYLINLRIQFNVWKRTYMLKDQVCVVNSETNMLHIWAELCTFGKSSVDRTPVSGARGR